MKRRLTPEEQELWRYVTRNDVPLYPDAIPPLPEMLAPAVSSGKKAAPAIRPTVRKWKAGMHEGADASALSSSPLACGAYAGIDRNTAERFRKGNYPIDAVLDLHGLSRDKAHRSLLDFLHHHHRAGERCVLVITGKGKKDAGGGGTGILREFLPRWLAEPELRDKVLALDVAKPKHGGSGAYYVLLRRRR